ncbi:MAG: gamma-glutamyl-gamma-aminobutyrate hydrolase family protein [Phycisphaeraceae bacterium]
MARPLIGITVDLRDNTASSGRYLTPMAYSRAVAEAGGLPVLLTHELACVADYVVRCDGFVLTGGNDIDSLPFGAPLHPMCKIIDPQRQAFELALMAALDQRRDKPVLGVCMGMQLMALHAGGRLDQHLPDILGEDQALTHLKDNRHTVGWHNGTGIDWLAPFIIDGYVTSSHHQAVADPGRLTIVAKAADGTVEAIADPARPFYLGVQWHPERPGIGANAANGSDPLGRELIARFIQAVR